MLPLLSVMCMFFVSDETKRVTEFYKRKGLPVPNDMLGGEESTTQEEVTKEEDKDKDNHRSDEQVNICLECNNSQLKNLKRRYIRCSSYATVSHLTKFLALKIYNNRDRFKDVSITLKHLEMFYLNVSEDGKFSKICQSEGQSQKKFFWASITYPFISPNVQ